LIGQQVDEDGLGLRAEAEIHPLNRSIQSLSSSRCTGSPRLSRRRASGPQASLRQIAGLDVVIVSFRSRDLLRRCLYSLRAYPPTAEMKVIVIDNASGDGTVQMVAADHSDVDLVASHTNLGFAAATNLGARRGDAPYLLALNPDTTVTEGALDAVLGVL